MIGAPIHLAGERLMLDPAGGLFWPETGLLAVSDLHLEKGSSAAARGGRLLPPWDTHATLDRLTLLLRRWTPRIVIALGDSFHDPEGSRRLPHGEVARLKAMTESYRFIWVLGNHDPRPPDGLGGDAVESFVTHPLVFRHEAGAGASASAGEIVGHHHPRASIQVRGDTVSRPCFVASSTRIMMPAFGAYTGGLDVGDPAIIRLFPDGGRVFLLGRERLFSFALRRTRIRRV
jgi:uncharacterized protein